MDIYESLAHNTKVYRKRLRISQEELAYRCGLARTQVGLIENGKNITLETLDRLAHGLEVSPMRLLVMFDDNGKPLLDYPSKQSILNELVDKMLCVDSCGSNDLNSANYVAENSTGGDNGENDMKENNFGKCSAEDNVAVGVKNGVGNRTECIMKCNTKGKTNIDTENSATESANSTVEDSAESCEAKTVKGGKAKTVINNETNTTKDSATEAEKDSATNLDNCAIVYWEIGRAHV